MAAPTLKIPVGLDDSQFQKGIDGVRNGTRQAAQYALKQFAEMNAGLAVGALAGYGAAALRLVGVFGAVKVSANLVGDAISATRDRLVEMVDVANKAQGTGVSAEFFQTFISGAKGAQDRIAGFEAALDHAFQATKPLLNPDWSVWDQGLTKVNAVEKAMRETRELFTTDQNFSGFDLFKDATTQDQKIKAVLVYMQQLKTIGQDVAALDIGEKMFGSQFVDRVRQGKESFDSMLRTLQAGAKETFVSNEAAKNAKDLDDRLKDAHNTITERLKPDWDDLASVALRIKGVWVEVLEAIAAYKTTAASLPPLPGSTAASNDLARNNPDPNSAAFANPAILNAGRRRRGQLPDGTAGVPGSPSGAAQGDAMASGWDYTGYEQPKPEAVPLPMRRPGDAPKPPPTTIAARDPFETTIDGINKRIAALKAETETVDLGTAARARATSVAQLEEAAKRANTAAGKSNTEVTAEQRAEIDKSADAYAKVAVAAEAARVASSIKFDAKTAFLTAEDVAIAEQLRGLYPDVAAALNSVEAAAMRTNHTMRDMATVGQDLNRSLFVEFGQNIRNGASAMEAFGKAGVNALGKVADKLMDMAAQNLWKSAFGGSGGAGGLMSLFGLGGGGAPGSVIVGDYAMPKFAAGTDYAPGGMALVGEKGPEVMHVPRGAQIIPNDVLRGGGGGITAPVNISIDARGADAGGIAKLQQQMAAMEASLPGRIVATVKTARAGRVL